MDLASAADCVLAVSETDGKTFLKHGIETVGIVGFSIQATPTPQSFSGRNGFLFVGAIHEEASPNGDSMIWFLEKILPKIHAELGSDIPFTIAGVNKSERVKQLATSSVKIVGRVGDLTEIYNAARVFVAPTRYAAGVPQKVYEAASRGLPVVATSLLASQLGWEDGNPFLVGKDSDSFAQKCIELHRNITLWEKLRDAGMERIRRECSVEVFESNLKDCLTRAGTGDRRHVEFD
jgi:glycosyltransferase involved in cell wall biosynthesis